MAKQLKLKRGTTSQHSSFTGAEGEVTVDTDKETLVVHDGSTAGGHPVAAEDMANVSSASIAGRLGTDSIATSKIAGGALPTDVTITNANIVANASIAGTKLENSGVTAGSYGSSSAIPIVTVDAQGLVTAASTTAIDSTTIANGTSSVAVANNANITITRGGSQIVNVSGGGIGITGDMSITGTVDGVDVAASDTLMRSVVASTANLNNGVTATTQAASDDSTKVATTAYVKDAITGYVFPSGTKMLFQQTSAPTGWTKVTSSVDNKALRVVSGTVGSGGTNAFTNTLQSRAISANAGNTTQGGNISVSVGNTTAGGNVSVGNTAAGGNVSVSINNANTGGNVNSHTLSTSQMPSHSHNGGFNPGYGTSSFNNQSPKRGNATSTGSTGGGGGHSHGFSGSSHNHGVNTSFSGSNHNHNASFSGNAHNHNASGNFSGSAHNHSISVGNLDLAVQYIDVIIASKD